MGSFQSLPELRKSTHELKKEEMPTKKYESRYSEEGVILHLPTEDKRIYFKGGGRYPKKRGGYFMTDDPIYQHALESRLDFKKRWKIIESYPTKDELLIEQAGMAKLEPKVISKIPEPVIEPKLAGEVSEKRIIQDLLNFQQVRNWLLKNFPGTTFSDLRSKEATKKFAAEQNIVFPKWNE